MKRKLYILAAASAAVLMTACGGDKGTTAETEVVETVETGSETEEESSEEETGESSEAETDEESADTTVVKTSEDGLSVEIKTEEMTYPEESDAESAKLTGKVQSIDVAEEELTGLKDALKAENASARRAYDEMWDSSVSIFEGENAPDTASVWSIETTVEPSRCDDAIFSFTRTDYSYIGGAHPNTYVTGMNYAPDSGEELALSDVVTDYDAVYEYVLNDLKEQAEENEDLAYFDDYESTVHTIFYGAGEGEKVVSEEDGFEPNTAYMPNWVSGEDGVYIIFNNYDIAPYAAGRITVNVPVSSGLLDGEIFG